MANQQHSSEIHVQLDDAQALQAIRTLSAHFAQMQQAAQQAIRATGDAARQAQQPLGAGAPAPAPAPTTPTDAQRKAQEAQKLQEAEKQRERAAKLARQATTHAAQAVASGTPKPQNPICEKRK